MGSAARSGRGAGRCLGVLLATALALATTACSGPAGPGTDDAADPVTNDADAAGPVTDDAADPGSDDTDDTTDDAPEDDAADTTGDPAGEDLLVAASPDLRHAFEELADRFEREHDVEVAMDLAASGHLAQRIVDGEPFDVFASADAGSVDQVLDSGRGDPGTRASYALGRLVVWWVPDGDSDRRRWTTLDEVTADPELTSFAIADPDHTPYGRVTQQALLAGGELEQLSDRLVLGEDVADTQRLIEAGIAEAGVLARSLAVAATDVRGVGTWFEVDEALYQPLRQDLVVVATDPDRAELAARFVALVNGEVGREVLDRHGFDLPDLDEADADLEL